ncbi:MAG: S24 family peptidase [Bacillota bacterium]|jgi:repressor LexA|nr:S24 family peptidase [Bacillota bacterium]NLL26551.1 helix-turn-helix domain-containing protein [Erysipelotrichia bacterium]
MNFATNLRYLRKRKNISQNELADYLGYKSFTTIQKWEDGSATPPYRVIVKIADFFGVETEELMHQNLPLNLKTQIPVLGFVRGGQPTFAEQQYIGFEHVFPDDARHSDCFYLEVVGDSMKDARILPQDLLYVKKQNHLNSGDIGVFLLDDSETTVKRVIYKNDLMILQPENEEYQPIILTAEDQKNRNVQIIGKVLHNRIKF